MARAVAEQDHDRLCGRIHDSQVGRAVAVQIGSRERAGPCVRGQWRRHPRTSATATVAQEDLDRTGLHFVPARVVGVETAGHSEIGRVVAVEVGDGHPGRLEACIERRSGYERRIDDLGTGRPRSGDDQERREHGKRRAEVVAAPVLRPHRGLFSASPVIVRCPVRKQFVPGGATREEAPSDSNRCRTPRHPLCTIFFRSARRAAKACPSTSAATASVVTPFASVRFRLDSNTPANLVFLPAKG